MEMDGSPPETTRSDGGSGSPKSLADKLKKGAGFFKKALGPPVLETPAGADGNGNGGEAGGALSNNSMGGGGSSTNSPYLQASSPKAQTIARRYTVQGSNRVIGGSSGGYVGGGGTSTGGGAATAVVVGGGQSTGGGAASAASASGADDAAATADAQMAMIMEFNEKIKRVMGAKEAAEEKLKATSQENERLSMQLRSVEASAAKQSTILSSVREMHLLRPLDELLLHYDPLTGSAGVIGCPNYLRRAIQRRSRKLLWRLQAARFGGGEGGRLGADHHHYLHQSQSSASAASSSLHAYTEFYSRLKERETMRMRRKATELHVLSSSSSSGDDDSDGGGAVSSSSSSSSGEETSYRAFQRRERRKERRVRRRAKRQNQQNQQQQNNHNGVGDYSASSSNSPSVKVKYVAPLGIHCIASCGPTMTVATALLKSKDHTNSNMLNPQSASDATAGGGNALSSSSTPNSNSSLPSCTTLATPSFCTYCGCRYARIIHKQSGAFVLPRFCTKCGRPAPRYLVNDLPPPPTYTTLSSSSAAAAGDATNAAARVHVEGLYRWDPSRTAMVTTNTGGGRRDGNGVGGGGAAANHSLVGGFGDAADNASDVPPSNDAFRLSEDGDLSGDRFYNNGGRGGGGGAGPPRVGAARGAYSTNALGSGAAAVSGTNAVDVTAAAAADTHNDEDEWAEAVLASSSAAAAEGGGGAGLGDDFSTITDLLAPSARFRIQQRYARLGRAMAADMGTQTEYSHLRESALGGLGPVTTSSFVGGGGGGGGAGGGGGLGLDDDFLLGAQDGTPDASSSIGYMLARKEEAMRRDEATRRIVASTIETEQARLAGTMRQQEAVIAELRSTLKALQEERASVVHATEQRVRDAVLNPRLEAGWASLMATVGKLS